MHPPARCALISITDRGKPPPQFQPGWNAVLRLAFDDVDPVAFPGMNPELVPFEATQAAELARYVSSQLMRNKRIVVHCRHGISRSAAVAKAIAEITGAFFPPAYRDHNRHVYDALRNALAAINPSQREP